ncbi:hypothetical protein [Jeotgalibacillus malaysiensis]|uniref:hypothetical protein n=1 Tax=Jeotgalibacillus malaysiensis TaxID=1508404 RepID=UPI0038509E90
MFSKKVLIPIMTLFILLSAFLYHQYREQKNETELQLFISIDYYIEHLDGFLSYQETLIENGFSEGDASEYDARKQALKLHGEGTVVYLGYNDKAIDTLREFPENLAEVIDQFQSAETADERRTHYEEAREARNELWHHRTDLQDYLHQKIFP